MVVVQSTMNKKTGAAGDAALAEAGQAVSRTLLTVQLKHTCRATACSDISCTLCSNSTLRTCSSELKQKYVAGSALQAPCGAWPVVELLSSQPGVLNTGICQLKISLIDDVKYEKLCLAGTSPAGNRLETCLASDAGLKYKGTESTEVTLLVEGGKASLTDLHIYKVPGGRSGHSTYYRLLFTTILNSHPEGKRSSSKKQQHTSGPSAAPTAAPFLTDKLQLITTRSKCNEKSDVLQASQPVRRVQAVGEGFAKVLADLKDFVPDIPEELAAVTKVGQFQQLVQWVKATANTKVPNLFRPNDWARSSQHVLSALLEDDTRQRLWFPSASGAGLLFQCQQGAVKLKAPASFVLMLGGRVACRPLSQLAPGQLQELLQKAAEDWQTAGHPNWSIYDRDKKPDSRGQLADRSAGQAAAEGWPSAGAGTPEAVLARAAIAAAFGGVAGKASAAPHKRAAKRKSAAASSAATAATSMACKASSSSGAATASPPASSAVQSNAAVVGASAAASASPHSTSSSSKAVEMPALDLSGPQSAAEAPTAIAVASAAVAADEAAVMAVEVPMVPLVPLKGVVAFSKRQQEVDLEEPTRPAKKLRLRLRSPQQQQQVELQVGLSAAVTAPTEPAASAAAVASAPATAIESNVSSQQQEELADADMTDALLDQLMYDGSMSDDWSSEFEPGFVADLEADPHSTLLQDMRQQLQEAEKQQEAAVLQMLYKSMSDDWCSELDADLSNNLGSSFLGELQQLQEDAAVKQQQQQGGDKCGDAAVLMSQESLSRLISLSDLPDFADLCDAMCLPNLSQGVDQLPIVLV